jgi:hypothetical protein
MLPQPLQQQQLPPLLAHGRRSGSSCCASSSSAPEVRGAQNKHVATILPRWSSRINHHPSTIRVVSTASWLACQAKLHVQQPLHVLRTVSVAAAARGAASTVCDNTAQHTPSAHPTPLTLPHLHCVELAAVSTTQAATTSSSSSRHGNRLSQAQQQQELEAAAARLASIRRGVALVRQKLVREKLAAAQPAERAAAAPPKAMQQLAEAVEKVRGAPGLGPGLAVPYPPPA